MPDGHGVPEQGGRRGGGRRRAPGDAADLDAAKRAMCASDAVWCRAVSVQVRRRAALRHITLCFAMHPCQGGNRSVCVNERIRVQTRIKYTCMCVCVCVCLCVCVGAGAGAGAYVSIIISICPCIYLSIHLSIHPCIHLRLCTCVSVHVRRERDTGNACAQNGCLRVPSQRRTHPIVHVCMVLCRLRLHVSSCRTSQISA